MKRVVLIDKNEESLLSETAKRDLKEAEMWLNRAWKDMGEIDKNLEKAEIDLILCQQRKSVILQ